MKQPSALVTIIGIAAILGMLTSACQGIEGNGTITGLMARSPEGCSVNIDIGDPEVEQVVVEYEMPDKPGWGSVNALLNQDLGRFVAHVPAVDEGKRGFVMADGTEYERVCALIREVRIILNDEERSYSCDPLVQEGSAELICNFLKNKESH